MQSRQIEFALVIRKASWAGLIDPVSENQLADIIMLDSSLFTDYVTQNPAESAKLFTPIQVAGILEIISQSENLGEYLTNYPDLVDWLTSLTGDPTLGTVHMTEAIVAMQLLFSQKLTRCQEMFRRAFQQQQSESILDRDQTLIKNVQSAWLKLAEPQNHGGLAHSYLGLEIEPGNIHGQDLELRSPAFTNQRKLAAFLEALHQLIAKWDYERHLPLGYFVNFHIHFGLTADEFRYWAAYQTTIRDFLFLAGLFLLPIERLKYRERFFGKNTVMTTNVALRQGRKNRFEKDHAVIQHRCWCVTAELKATQLMRVIDFTRRALRTKRGQELMATTNRLDKHARGHLKISFNKSHRLSIPAVFDQGVYLYLADLWDKMSAEWLEDFLGHEAKWFG